MKLKIFMLKIINKILSLLCMPSFLRRYFNDIYHNCKYSLLQHYFYKAFNIIKKKHIGVKNVSNIIWMFWWQGTSNMPVIVHKCIESVFKHSNGHKVIFLSKYNLKKYIKLPEYIIKKVNNGNITLTHFSDIIRFNLLNNYGGLWIDSTMYCSSPLDNNYFNGLYTSGGYNNKNHGYVSTKWTGFLIGGYKHNKLFQFMNEFYKLYWRNNNKIDDYFLMDYALSYAYRYNINNFKRYVDMIAWKNNPHLYSLVNNLNSKFSREKYDYMITDTNLFKLTYKRKFNNKNNTFYNKLINDKL